MNKISNGDEMRDVLKGIMKERKLSINAWSKLAGVSEGTMRFFLNGTNNSLKVSTLERYLQALGLTIKDIGIENSNKVTISGYLRDGAEIHDGDGDNIEVEMPMIWRLNIPLKEISAIKVTADFLLPLIQKNWIIYYHIKNDFERCNNKLCLIKTTEGKFYIKELTEGSKHGHHTLRGFNTALMENIKIASAYPIISIEPD